MAELASLHQRLAQENVFQSKNEHAHPKPYGGGVYVEMS
jgi:hypothetical protein